MLARCGPDVPFLFSSITRKATRHYVKGLFSSLNELYPKHATLNEVYPKHATLNEVYPKHATLNEVYPKH